MNRAEQELDIIEGISQVLGENLLLEQVFQRAMKLVSDDLGVRRAALVLLDPTSGQLKTYASVGLTPSEQERGRYALGEGVTGRVMKTGESAVLRDVEKDPEFLNRTGASGPEETAGPGEPEASEPVDAGPISFVCVPVLDGKLTVGTISIQKPLESDEQLAADARLLRIVAGLFSQAIRIHDQVRLERDQWQQEEKRLRDNLRSRYKFDNIIGSSPAMLDVLGTIGQVADSRATVLLLGETGCGKELIAKAIHYNSPRDSGPLIRVNCGALSPQLLESELFGHVKGAFTGAMRDKIGRFEAADRGTLFLDEVGTLEPQLQVKLLRVLQEREVERVGEHKSRKVDVRVIAATNLNLEAEVERGSFREDLYYRLNVVTVNLPPLRSRREDIPALVEHFLHRYNEENGRNLERVARETLSTLVRYPWPGNVRELENMIERAVVLSTSDELTPELLPLAIRMFAAQTRGDGADASIDGLSERLAEAAVRQYASSDGRVYELVIQQIERHLLKQALRHNGGVKIRTADFLGINRNTLNKKVKDLGLDA